MVLSVMMKAGFQLVYFSAIQPERRFLFTLETKYIFQRCVLNKLQGMFQKGACYLSIPVVKCLVQITGRPENEKESRVACLCGLKVFRASSQTLSIQN